jgi:hypothetical protein
MHTTVLRVIIILEKTLNPTGTGHYQGVKLYKTVA